METEVQPAAAAKEAGGPPLRLILLKNLDWLRNVTNLFRSGRLVSDGVGAGVESVAIRFWPKQVAAGPGTRYSHLMCRILGGSGSVYDQTPRKLRYGRPARQGDPCSRSRLHTRG